MKLERIVSGGQTGADRGGLKAAIAVGLKIGGWCPKGRKAEDGEIPEAYRLKESTSGDYRQRTELNVRDSNVTVVFSGGVSGGSALTVRCCERLNKPYLVIDPFERPEEKVAEAFMDFIRKHDPKILNVAGNRESKSPGIEAKVERIVLLAFARYSPDGLSDQYHIKVKTEEVL